MIQFYWLLSIGLAILSFGVTMVRSDDGPPTVTAMQMHKKHYYQHLFEEGDLIPVYSTHVHPIRNPSETYLLSKTMSYWFSRSDSDQVEEAASSNFSNLFSKNTKILDILHNLRKASLGESLFGERILLSPFQVQFKSRSIFFLSVICESY
jgi:hypothetical protein